MSTATPPSVQAFDEIRAHSQRLRAQLARVIVGQDQIIEQLLVALFSQGHILIVGVPGLAKTLLVRTLAQALDLHYRRIQFTPDMMPSDILGTELIQEDPHSHERALKFLPGPIFAQLILADEINRTPPKTQAALLEAMAERQVTVAGRTLPLEQPFVVVATQNPIEQEGTYPLPEAALDRFMFSLWMDYPTQEEEVRIVGETPRIQTEKVERIFNHAALLQSIDAIGRMPVSQHVVNYAVALARATRPNGEIVAGFNGKPGGSGGTSGGGGSPRRDAVGFEGSGGALAVYVKKYVQWGAGPRAGQYLTQGAKALAALEGEPTPNCQHIRRIAPAVLRHRIIPNYAATGENIGSQQIIARVLQDVPEPKYEAQ